MGRLVKVSGDRLVNADQVESIRLIEVNGVIQAIVHMMNGVEVPSTRETGELIQELQEDPKLQQYWAGR